MKFIKKNSSLYKTLAHTNTNMPMLFLSVITGVAIAIFIQYDRMNAKSYDARAKAYTQTATGIRIEAEDMTLSGTTKDPSGLFIRF
jgi:hypothetical protein